MLLYYIGVRIFVSQNSFNLMHSVYLAHRISYRTLRFHQIWKIMGWMIPPRMSLLRDCLCTSLRSVIYPLHRKNLQSATDTGLPLRQPNVAV